MSLPSRERGSKLVLTATRKRDAHVAPFAGAWIETTRRRSRRRSLRSLPSRERGSKLLRHRGLWQDAGSLPSRERGSKHTQGPHRAPDAQVAPFAGAWIETTLSGRTCDFLWSLPSRERGSKPTPSQKQERIMTVAPFAGAWIETRPLRRAPRLARVAPFAG